MGSVDCGQLRAIISARRRFLSFCLELNEHFTPGQSYSYSISDAAVRGGESVSDPISVGTGYLYSLFAMGSLPGSTTALQRAIWQLEGEIPLSPNAFDSVLTEKFGSLATAALDSHKGKTAEDYGVRVINVSTPPRYAGQDQLVYTPPVNLPDSGGIGSVSAIAIAALAALKRKMSR